MAEVQMIHGADEFDEAKSAAKVVIFDFSAVWCGPCRALGPILDEIANEATENVKLFKVDVDENEDLARKFRITAVPAVAIYKDGELVKGQLHVGLRAKSYYTEIIDQLLSD